MAPRFSVAVFSLDLSVRQDSLYKTEVHILKINRAKSRHGWVVRGISLQRLRQLGTFPRTLPMAQVGQWFGLREDCIPSIDFIAGGLC